MKLTFTLLILLITELAHGQVITSWIENQGDFKDSIPIEYIKGRIYLKIKLKNDTSNYRFLFDTGAPCTIDNKIASKFNFKEIKKIKSGSSINGKSDSTTLISISEIHIGSIEFKNTLASIISTSYISTHEGIKIDGILGANLMKLCVWQINLKNGYIYITKKHTQLNYINKKQYFKFDSYGLQGSPLVKVSYNNKLDEAAIFDTGSQTLYTMSQNAFNIGFNNKIFNSNEIRKEEGKRGTVFGEANLDSLTFLTLKSLQLDEKLNFNNLEVEVLTDVSLIGTKFLEQYIVTFDFNRNKIYYKNY